VAVQRGFTGWVADDYGCHFYKENGIFTGQIDCQRPATERWAPGCYEFLDGPHYWDGERLSGLGCSPETGVVKSALRA
jgi:hypothetical protein